MASQKSKRRSRKRRSTAAELPGAASARRQQPSARRSAGPSARRTRRELGSDRERPPSPFGGLPISEFAILAGAVALIVGLIGGGGPALVVGIIVCALGVVEVTAREHFSGYRSHAALLAGLPAVGVEFGLGTAVGGPHRGLLLLVVVPVFGTLFWFLRRRFHTARQARVARRPAR